MSIQPPQQQDSPPPDPQEPQEGRPLYSTSPQKPSEVVAVSVVPQAPLHWRLLAAVLDIVLVTLFSLMLLHKVLLPMDHPEAYNRYLAQSAQHTQQILQAYEKGEEMGLAQLLPSHIEEDPAIAAMIGYGLMVSVLFLLLYFVLCERFMRGSTLGKAMFRLRVVSLRSGGQPSLWESFARNFFKIFALMSHILWVTFLFVFFNRLRRAGHDWLSNTVVISDIIEVRNLPLPAQSGDGDAPRD